MRKLLSVGALLAASALSICQPALASTKVVIVAGHHHYHHRYHRYYRNGHYYYR
jgi:hypothetical protein